MKPIEGFESVLGFNLFFKQLGRPTKGEILCLRGGPGATHDYLLSMTDFRLSGCNVLGLAPDFDTENGRF